MESARPAPRRRPPRFFSLSKPGARVSSRARPTQRGESENQKDSKGCPAVFSPRGNAVFIRETRHREHPLDNARASASTLIATLNHRDFQRKQFAKRGRMRSGNSIDRRCRESGAKFFATDWFAIFLPKSAGYLSPSAIFQPVRELFARFDPALSICVSSTSAA